MRVKKLDLFGFKSFASRQSLTFGAGVTGVVGPNGCGKSNVVDALRWVMGEQNARHLRGGNMQDIIFCGSEKKAPLGFAEVTLTLENHDQSAPLDYNHYEEIQITRRLYKSGESEYEINKQKARLKDISEFFLGTGVGTKAYSIIEQGRINEVISAKPFERRTMIEEAAGITKYKAKKALAERRMEATRVNLDRIIDIRNEVDKRVTILAREKAKLLEQKELKDKLWRLDMHLASHRYLEIKARLTYSSASKQKINDELVNHKRDMAFKEQAFSSVLENYARKHDQRRMLEELSVQHQNAKELLKKDQEYAKRTLEDNQLFMARVLSQLADLDQRKVEIEQQSLKLLHDQESTDNELMRIKEAIGRKKDLGQQVIYARQHNLLKERDTQAKIVQAAADAARLKAEISAFEDKEVQKKNELINLAQEIELKGSEIREKASYLGALSDEHQRAEVRHADLQKQLSLKEDSIKALLQKIGLLTIEVNEGEDMLRKNSSRLQSLQEIDQQLEWSESGVLFLKDAERDLIKGVLADAIRVNPGFEAQVEKCLAEVLDAALIDNTSELERATKRLKSHKSASTSFFILDDQEHQPLSEQGSLKSINDYLSIDDERFKSLRPKLARYLVASDLSEALKHWPSSRKSLSSIITHEGEMLLPDGRVVILGPNSKDGVLKRKNEQSDLVQKIAILGEELALKGTLLAAHKGELSELEKEKASLLEEIRPLSMGLIRLEENIKQKNNDLKNAETLQEKLEDKRHLLLETASSADEDRALRQKNWADILERHRELTEELEITKDAHLSSEQNYELHMSELKAMEIGKASLEEKLSSLKTLLEDARKNLEHASNQHKALNEQSDEKNDDELKLKEVERQAQGKIAAFDKELEDIARQLVGIKSDCLALSEQKISHELSIAASKNELEKCLGIIHASELQIKDLENDLLNLCARIEERHRTKLFDHLTDFHALPLNESIAKKDMEELKRHLDKMGLVNENALVEYEEFKKRQDFLVEQISDLESALEQLAAAINKINKTTKMRFEEAFNGINKHFQVVFPRLFNGGRAELVLTDQDMLTAGIEILAKPPGKNIGSIELLSGGEKALTAISLVMAIFLIKPSPFCLLDEVDAPLDEANVSRFSQLIREMSAMTQFIVITHNRKTMESADQLYGVTMEEAGSSKVVSVEVQQAFDALKQKPKAKAIASKATQLPFDELV